MSVSNVEFWVGRILIAALFLLAGIAKIVTPAPYVEHMAAHHLASFLLPAVIGLELIGGLVILLGWRLEQTALAMAAFCVATAVIFHFDFADKAERTLFFKDLAIAGGLLVLAARK